MNLGEYRSVCHGELIKPYLFTEDDPPKDRPPQKIIICQCLKCSRLCSIRKDKA